MNHYRRVLPLFLAMMVGCSARGTYEGIQTSEQIACGRLPPSQYEECMARNSQSYEDYQRDREAAADAEAEEPR